MKKSLLILAASLVFAGAATAADLPAQTFTKAAAMVAPAGWTGCYIGVNVGGGSDRESFTHINPLFGIVNFNADFDLGSQHATGAMGGGQAGCDYQAGNWVFGAQGMFDAAGFTGNNHVVPGPGDPQFPNVFDLSSRVSWVATATARLGYAVQPQLLVYARGGAAWMRSDLTYMITGQGITNTYTRRHEQDGRSVAALKFL